MKHFISLDDLSAADIHRLIALARRLKAERREGVPHPLLAGKTLGMLFSKPSTRTRVSFEAGMYQLGGYPLCLNANDMQLGRGEPMGDTARTLSRYVDAVMIRTFAHSDVEELARHGTVPAINGLTDEMHPTQVVADLMTVEEEKGALRGLKLAYIGDGNNVAHSLLHGCAKVGMDIAVATPQGFMCKERYVEEARAAARASGSAVAISNDPRQAAEGADAVYTDTWVSMGQDAGKEAKEARLKAFDGFQVDDALFSLAKADAIFLHCLPAYRGFEVAASVIDGPRSRVFDEAENRLHAHKAILVDLLLA